MRCAFVSKETGLDFRSDGKPNSKFPVGFFSSSVKWNSQNRTGFSSKDGAWWSRRQWLRLFSLNRVSEVLNHSLSLDDCMSLQFSSVQSLSCVQLCNPRDCSMPGLPVHHQLPEFTQTHVHWVGDTIQPYHPLPSPSPPAFNLFQHQGLFQWVSSSHQVAKVLEFQLQYQSFQWILKTDFL